MVPHVVQFVRRVEILGEALDPRLPVERVRRAVEQVGVAHRIIRVGVVEREVCGLLRVGAAQMADLEPLQERDDVPAEVLRVHIEERRDVPTGSHHQAVRAPRVAVEELRARV